MSKLLFTDHLGHLWGFLTLPQTYVILNQYLSYTGKANSFKEHTSTSTRRNEFIFSIVASASSDLFRVSKPFEFSHEPLYPDIHQSSLASRISAARNVDGRVPTTGKTVPKTEDQRPSLGCSLCLKYRTVARTLHYSTNSYPPTHRSPRSIGEWWNVFRHSDREYQDRPLRKSKAFHIATMRIFGGHESKVVACTCASSPLGVG